MSDRGISWGRGKVRADRTIVAPRLETPRTAYLVQVLRRRWIALFHPPRWETWKVMASSPVGAVRLAERTFLFPKAVQIRLLGEE